MKKAKPGLKKQILNIGVLLTLIGVTFYMIFRNSDEFSIHSLADFVNSIHWPYLLGAFVCMLLFIGFEGAGIGVLSRALGYKRKLRQNYAYASADIYFSAITPSATGGQPASAFYMVKDGIPLSYTTAILSVNLFMYTATLLVVVLIAFLLRPHLFLEVDSVLVKICIVAGLVVQLLLLAIYTLIMISEKLVIRLATWLVNILAFLHITKHRDAYLDRIGMAVRRFKASITLLRGSRRTLVVNFFLNLLQRFSYLSIGVLVFFGAKYHIPALADVHVSVLDVYVLQALCQFAAYCIPLPGSVGASEAIFNSIFSMIITDKALLGATMVTTRGINFYISFMFAGLVTLIHHLSVKYKKRKEEQAAPETPAAETPSE